LRIVNENGKTTVTGKIDPKLIKIGLVLIIAVFGYGVINFLVGWMMQPFELP
jgi:phage shock protein PspC (stress-responsive transcriptional regulator)